MNEIIDRISNVTGVKYSDEQLRILNHNGGMVIIACAGSGKSLKNGTGVLTPSGYKRIEDLKVGDICYGVDGKEQIVVGVYPQGKKEIYNVVFSDGVVIPCCKDHLWTYKLDEVSEWKTDTTEKILASMNPSNSSVNTIYIPTTEAVEFKGSELPIEPYRLGYILSSNKSILKELPDDMINTLNSLGIDENNRFIPDIYKYSYIEDRRRLLCGIVDIKGDIKENSYEIVIKDERFVDDIRFICETLGFIANKYENRVDDKVVYRLLIKTSKEISRIHTNISLDSKWVEQLIMAPRHIKEIIKTGEYEEMTCIKVSNADGLFLTEHCVVTHNTTVLTHLLAKRVLSGEIKDTNKLLCTTYSKAGANEMEERLDKLFKKLGLKCRITVKTLHATYYSILKHFGINANVIDGATRLKYINDACREAKVKLSDGDLQTIDSLLSFQVNNLMSDKDLVLSYVYTLDNVSQAQYTDIRTRYNAKKQGSRLIDFDDMQLYMYSLLVKEGREDILQYCRSQWDTFFVDEAQDISRIQFEIMRKIATDPDRIVYIGDDDQCLIEGTEVETHRGKVPIEDVKPGDMMRTGIGRGKTEYIMLDNISKKKIKGEIVVIKTKGGRELKGTGNHIGFARHLGMDKCEGKYKLNYTMFNSEHIDKKGIYKSALFTSTNDIEYMNILNNYISSLNVKEETKNYSMTSNNIDVQEDIIKKIKDDCADKGIYLEVNKDAKFNDNKYMFMPLSNMREGMYVPVLENGLIEEDEIVSVSREWYEGYVYDISVTETRNFIANDIVVHNCIYQWRGADPSIILNLCGYYDIEKFILSTNYRCKSNIVEPASVGIQFNTGRSEKTMKANVEGGTVRVCDTGGGDIYNQSLHALHYIKDLIMDKGVDPGDIAVLSRNNLHLTVLNNMLFKEGVYCEAAPDMKYTNSTIYRDLKNVIELAKDTYDKFTVANSLWRVCLYLGVRGSNTIADLQSSMGASLTDTLGYMLSKHSNKDVDWEGDMNIPTLAAERISSFMLSLREETINHLEYIYNVITKEDDYVKLKSLFSLYMNSCGFMYKAEDTNRILEGYINYMLSIAKEDGLDRLKEFNKVSEQFESGRLGVPGSKVCMSTMHGAKGREWKYVVMFADDNVTFPSFEGIRGMIENGVKRSDINASINENRRLHYVAMTRAKDELVIFTDAKNVGMYTLEAFGLFKPKVEDSNNFIIDMAMKGSINPVLVDRAKNALFTEGGEYYYKVDIKKNNE